MKTTIRVTNQHIRRGVPCLGGRCALALAIRESVTVDVTVKINGVRIGNRTVPLPPEARRFRRDFDMFESGKPFEFELDVPTEYLRTDAS